MTSMDVCFLVDCSSSMSRSIGKMQPQMKELMRRMRFEIDNKRKNCSIRFAVVLFRDHDYKTKRLESFDFSDYDEDAFNAIDGIEPIGGHDTPEDVLGGLNCAANLSWEGDSRHIIFIGDAPCHGTKYHSLIDSYPDGDPLGLTPEGVLGEMRQKSIQFIFVKLHHDTDLMIQVFTPIYENDPNDSKKGSKEDSKDSEEEDSENQSKKVKLTVLDCRKENVYHAKEMLIDHLVKQIREPLTLLYSAARVVRQCPNWTDYIEYIPLEMEEFIKDVLDDDVPPPSPSFDVVGSIHVEIQSVTPAGSPQKSGSASSSPVNKVLFKSTAVEVSL